MGHEQGPRAPRLLLQDREPAVGLRMLIQRQSGAPSASRTNHPMTKLCVISRSWRSPRAGFRNSATASSIWARPASISLGRDRAEERRRRHRGVSGDGPDGTQSNSSADGSGVIAGMRSAMIAAVSAARCSGECQAASNGTPPSRSASSCAWRDSAGREWPVGQAVLGVLLLAVADEIEVVGHRCPFRVCGVRHACERSVRAGSGPGQPARAPRMGANRSASTAPTADERELARGELCGELLHVVPR